MTYIYLSLCWYISSYAPQVRGPRLEAISPQDVTLMELLGSGTYGEYAMEH